VGVLWSCLATLLLASACGADPGTEASGAAETPKATGGGAATPKAAGAPSIDEVTRVFDAAVRDSRGPNAPAAQGSEATAPDLGTVSEALDSLGTTDITGTSLGVFMNYADKTATTPTDHPAPTFLFPPAEQALLNTPLSSMFDTFWSGTKDSNGKTLRDRTSASIVSQVQSGVSQVGSGFTAYNISVNLPMTGRLTASITSNVITLTYLLSGIQVHFTATTPATGSVLGLFTIPDPKFTATADAQLAIKIPIPKTPCNLVPTATMTVSNANISADNWTADVGEVIGGVLNFVQNKPLAVFQSAEQQIDQTTTADVGAFSSTLGNLAPACGTAVAEGFTGFDAFVDPTKRTLNFRFIHPTPEAPSVYTFDGPTFSTPTLVAKQTEISAGGQTSVSGTMFPVDHSTRLEFGWSDTISSGLVESDVQWASIWDILGNTVHSATLTRQDNDGQNAFTATGLSPNTTYFFRVRDCDLLTCSAWSTVITDATAASVTTTEVDLFLTYGGSDHAVGTGTVDLNGSFSANITVAADAPSGTYPLVAKMSGQSIASTNLIVVAAGQPLTPVLECLDPNTGAVLENPVFIEDSPVTAHGEGFAPGATVSLYFDSTSGPALGTVNADGSGSFTTVVTVPASQAGTDSIIATETVNGQTEQASFPLVVEQPPR
jgi:hypothetical protein